MKASALEWQERVVKFLNAGGAKAEAARQFDLGRRTVYRCLAAAKTGTLAPQKSWGKWRKLDPTKLQAHVKKHPAATRKEMQAVFGASEHAVWVRLGQWGFTLKKLMKYRARNKVQRWLVRREREKFPGRSVFYLDACGVDHRQDREFGRAPRGERIDEAVAGKRRARPSFIAASQQGKLVAPLVFQGRCPTEWVDAYWENMLLPELPAGSVIVWDNARFHQA